MTDGEMAALNESDATPVLVADDDHTEGYKENLIKGNPTPKAMALHFGQFREPNF